MASIIHTVAASMAGRLATVPEESGADGSTAYPPSSLYRDWIRTVAMSGVQIRSTHPTLFSRSQPGRYGSRLSSYSSDSASNSSYPSKNSGSSSVSASAAAAAADFGGHELRMIANQMISDGYVRRMVQAFIDASSADGVVESWFLELDVDWVLQIRQEHGSQGQLRLHDNLGLSLQDLIERWIRGLTVMVICINESVFLPQDMGAVARLGQATISKMVVFVDAIVPVLKPENLRAMLDMYMCLRRAKYKMINYNPYYNEHSELDHLYASSVDKLKKAIFSTIGKVRTIVEDDDLWAIEIPRGGGEVHRNTRLVADCIVYLGEAEAGDSIFLSIDDSESLSGLREDTIRFLTDLLIRKSELCPDPSLRYLFLLNNSYFVVEQVCEPSVSFDFSLSYTCDKKLTPECEDYMGSYLEISWGHVLSCIPKSRFPGPLHRWINSSSLAKFESAFRKTYQAQKFWKVPDPRLRAVLRRVITQKVISGYRDYLWEHPELEKHVGHESSSPEVLEKMLEELFEG